MDFNKLTLKSQEAVAGAQELARRAGQPGAHARPPHDRAPRPGASAHARRSRRLRRRRPARRGGGAPAPAADGDGRRRSRRPPHGSAACSTPRSTRCARSATSSSRSSISCSRSTSSRATSCSRRSQGVRGGQKVTSQDPEGSYQALEKYGRDLTALAESGKLDPVIGRDEEIRRVIQVLSRRTKNNPVLIGEPGVGKTAIVEGLAQRIVAGDVPEGLKGKRVWALDVGALLAGREVPRRVRGAAQGRPRGDPERRRRDRPLHRRAAHDRRRRRGRGRRRRGQPPEADARARRAARGRRDDARRVPQAHREGRRARAALPAGLRRPAVGRGHDRDPARPEGALRGAPRRRDPRLRARRRGRALRPLHHRPVPPRQGDRPRRRGRVASADGDRLVARRARRGRSARAPARDRARRDGERARERARAARARARRCARRSATSSPRAGRARRRRCSASPRSSGRSTSCAWRPSARSARATSRASPRSATGSSPSSRRSSPSARSARRRRW